MYEFLRGRLVRHSGREVVLDVGGIGYILHVPAASGGCPAPGDDVAYFVHLQVTDDALTLWGFADPFDRMLFRTILTVQGFGPSRARDLLSAASAATLREWILNEDVDALAGLRGVSAVTARKLVAALATRIRKLAAPSDGAPEEGRGRGDARQRDAVQALVVLGYAERAAETAVARALEAAPPGEPVESVVRRALLLAE